MMVLLITILLSTQTASAYTSSNGTKAPEKLEVYVGYWGGPYTLKTEFSRQELESMADYEGYYSYITRVGTVMLQYAKGVSLEKILKSSQIDKSSIRQIDFYTVDVKDQYFTSKGRTELLDTTRYYYPNLRANGYTDWNTSKWVVTDDAMASSGAVVVPTILATQQYATKDPNEMPTPAQISPEDSFRLCSGQVDTSTPTSFESAKWVHSIYVIFSGSPPENIIINEGESLNVEVGSRQKLSVTLIGKDIPDFEKGRVVWSSSDSSIVKVDQAGRITVLKDGTATITVTTSTGKTASIVINPKKEKAPETKPNKEVDNTYKNSETKNISGDGSGKTQGTSGNSSKSEFVVPDSAHNVPKEKAHIKKEMNNVNLSGYSQILVQGIVGEDEAASVKWRKDDMSETATELGKIEKHTSGKRDAIILSASCALIGITLKTKKFLGDI